MELSGGVRTPSAAFNAADAFASVAADVPSPDASSVMTRRSRRPVSSDAVDPPADFRAPSRSASSRARSQLENDSISVAPSSDVVSSVLVSRAFASFFFSRASPRGSFIADLMCARVSPRIRALRLRLFPRALAVRSLHRSKFLRGECRGIVRGVARRGIVRRERAGRSNRAAEWSAESRCAHRARRAHHPSTRATSRDVRRVGEPALVTRVAWNATVRVVADISSAPSRVGIARYRHVDETSSHITFAEPAATRPALGDVRDAAATAAATSDTLATAHEDEDVGDGAPAFRPRDLAVGSARAPPTSARSHAGGYTASLENIENQPLSSSSSAHVPEADVDSPTEARTVEKRFEDVSSSRRSFRNIPAAASAPRADNTARSEPFDDDATFSFFFSTCSSLVSAQPHVAAPSA